MNDRRPIPADQPARELATRSRDHALWIEAGAGTGKTTLLVARILSLLTDAERPLRLARLAAITFTEKAAGELKVKIRQELEKALAATSEDRRELLTQALRDLETAAIGTLHSFARLLLAELPVEAGIDPRAEVLDEAAFNRLLAETYDEWFDQRIRDPEAAPILRWYLREREFRQRRDDWDYVWRLANEICRNPDELLEAEPPATDFTAMLAELRGLAAAALEHARRFCGDPENEGFRQVADFAAALDNLPSPDEREAFPPAVDALPDFHLGKGKAAGWRDGGKDENKEFRARLKAARATLRQIVREPEMRRLFELARQFGRHFLAVKRRRGLLDFQDLLLLAGRLLRENKAARAYFQQRFDALLIDEFQDTDPLQVEIAFFLAEDGAVADRVEDVRLKPGKLVVVGDPKQSIYRFRRADIEVYEKTRRALLAGAEPTHIAVNFRSAPGIIDFVNAVFPPLMKLDPAMPVSPDYVPLVAGRRDAPDGAGVIVLQGDRPAEDGASARAYEFAAVAAWIRATHAAGLPVYDKDAGAERPLRWRDVAILDSRASKFLGLEQALRQAGVPYRLEGGKVFYRREEIAAAVNGLTALEDPDDRLALAQWLGSELVGFADEDLLLHVLGRDDRELRYFGDVAQPGDEIGEMLAAMRALHAARNRVGCLATVRGLFDLVGALPTALTLPHAEVAVANLHKLLAAARAADRSRLTFGEFAREWAAAYREEREEADFAITEDADDVVRILTIHKAKGLDWPVVVALELNVDFRAAQVSPVKLFRRATGELGLCVADNVRTANYERMKREEAGFGEAERIRQLYVALTRARDYLVLPFFPKYGRGKNRSVEKPVGFAEFFQRAGMLAEDFTVRALAGAQWKTVALDGLKRADLPRWELPALVAEGGLSAATKELVEEWLARRRPPAAAEVPAAPALVFESPSRLAAESPAAPATRSAGLKMGLAFHTLMERLDLDEPLGWGRTAAEVAVEYELSSRETAWLREWHENLLRLPSFARVMGARVWREAPFVWRDPDGTVYSGKMDLIAEKDGAAVILDYKTGRVAPEQLGQRVAEYRRQGEIYRAAVRELLGCENVTMVFCFVSLGREVVLE
ncbi:MAG: UvrD-helicase domain-containing protein [Myxococcales bacterium]|nr:UvrD-helicase domain-containing protein [Myxococcales bacterium]